jgi:hypothetical protein
VNGVKFIGRKLHDGCLPLLGFLLPAADLAAHPSMSIRVREEVGAANFAARGPILIFIAWAAVRKEILRGYAAGIGFKSCRRIQLPDERGWQWLEIYRRDFRRR